MDSSHINSPSSSPVHSHEAWSSTRKNSREVLSPTRNTGIAPRDAWSPAQRSSLNSATRSSSISRDTSGRSRASLSSMHSPMSFLPTRETSPRSMPSPSSAPCRDPPSSSSEHTSNHSPLSHIGSTPEPLEITIRPIPLTVSVPTPKRRSLPTRWVKETDIDEPLLLNLSPIASPVQEFQALQSRYGGSCRKVLAGLDVNLPQNGFIRRSKSKDERSTIGVSASPCRSQRTGSRATLHSIPIFLSNESVRSDARSSQRDASPAKKAMDSPEEMHKLHQQMALSHVQTLSLVADRLADDMIRGEEPVSRNQLGQLEFSHFVISSPHPMLTKGKSLFYNAVLPRPGSSDYPVTLMIAPCSQYAPLMRHGGSQLFALPGFLELEDQDGSVSKFLHDTGTVNLEGRHTKVVAMPRLNLCSFHSLAAHHLNEEFLLAYRFAPNSQAEIWEFPRLIFLPETHGAEIESGGDELVGLCRYAMRALCTLLHHRMDGKAPPIRLRSRYSRALLACATLLQEDKSSSLTKAKNVLEVALWGGDNCRNDAEARVWLEVARAECVDALLRQLVCEPGCRLGARERYRVEFLLGATPRSIVESQAAIVAANAR
ncbi:hypothetical protein RB195_014181 [Necator americanus]|uniref:Uncharacterized protein n=1 Tax=Necator americanus TaxID=51031 RepID=A0ABR1DZ02_NECAM